MTSTTSPISDARGSIRFPHLDGTRPRRPKKTHPQWLWASPDGITIRTYRHDDVDLIRALSHHLSAASLYHRFFIGTPHIPASYLHSLRSVDHWDREVLIALHEELHPGALAIAEYTRDAERSETADLGMLVADAWQRRRLAHPLLETLGEIALTRGITHFAADVLPTNEAAHAAIHRYRPGSPSTRAADGTRRFLLETRLPLGTGGDPGSSDQRAASSGRELVAQSDTSSASAVSLPYFTPL